MKRYIAGLACAATAVLSAPALASTAHAQAADPVTALKSQFGGGRGVSFVDTTKSQGPEGNVVFAKRTGEFQFGASGIIASDQTAQLRIKQQELEELLAATEDAEDTEDAKNETLSKVITGMAKPERVVRVKDTSYVSGGVMGEFLPADKTWVRNPPAPLGLIGSMSQYVNPAEPATLKALLAHATKRAGVYSGKITLAELQKVSPWFRASSPFLPEDRAKSAVSWKLYVGADQLPQRLVTTYSEGKDSSTTVDTRYTGWGSKVTIEAPAADQVAEMKELEKGVKAVATIPLIKN
ncbi:MULTISPECIES: hypothetical protein [Streptosporangium]|uniref:Lipoprotein n=1 Tax=Streptosporangium brasiliense TaxID=47480 RepID=A0ABT9R1Z5_9ACTN|nr:hypothetical protein [Streptosporangium brasiliense]MDP9862926.1 hypothetical protein [Streptosporangium brasiliense]